MDDQLSARRAREGDEGFTLIEVIVAMFLLAIIALGLIPGLVGALKMSALNSTIATASQLVGQQLDDARSRAATCTALQAYQAETIAPVVDARGVSLQPKRTTVVCPPSYPGVVTINVYVTKTGSTFKIASATTYIFVSAAS
ncbi:type II secretion system protein [Diaminobutyricibacter tongyongensis]|uniref:Type II secretion system protein n=1 Tax=Leifsonia tongyongensis TaxID=1268043 RepID=A0A6L9XT07_9MICO|nr:type II secretion system protein [Diaminobutyricibacter tongyongensis]NEN04503.1 type II secretion system protein [Diaminobutyricibacter tongyongensis]